MDEKIKEKIEELRKLGKEESELKLWSDLLPNMTEEEKKTAIKFEKRNSFNNFKIIIFL